MYNFKRDLVNMLAYEIFYQRCGFFRIGKERRVPSFWEKIYGRFRKHRSHFSILFFNIVSATSIFSTSHE